MTSVLLVEDEPSIALALKRYLQREGFDAFWAEDASGTSQLLADRAWDVVIVDLRLGDHEGNEGLEAIQRARAVNPSVVSVLLSAYLTPATEEHARSLGVDAFVKKPKPLPDIVQIVHGLLERTR